jgi:diaminohydroxyphosphoribosylaminopyrimidine deaminase/5-amino-6-(5-phosphoribosylamino)uracil reductase
VTVAAAGITRVVVATMDPNPLVGGKGLTYLREHGVEVRAGVLEQEAARLNVAFFTALRKRRPWVVLKVATSLTGAVAAGRGQRTPLTSREANREVHRFRAEVDAIAIGSETLLIDDPQLTVRGVYRGRPLTRVIFDSRLRTPVTASVFKDADAGPIVVATTPEGCRAEKSRAESLRAAGADLLLASRHDLGGILRQLADREIRSIVVEGGPTLHRALWDTHLVDKVQVIVTPSVLSDDAVRWDMPRDFSPMALANLRITPMGPDVLMEGECSLD